MRPHDYHEQAAHARRRQLHGLARMHMRRRFRRQRRPLQRQLFFSFGLAIVVAMGVSAWVGMMLPVPSGARPFGRAFAYVAGGLVVWAIAGAWARRLVGPLRELTRAASELGEGKLASRAHLPHYGTSEVLELGQRFNDMAARIEEQVKSQSELMHAVSHELRTPLARIRVLLGILADSETHPKLTRDLEREVLELDQLVGELLANARIDGGALQKRTLSTHESVSNALTRAGLGDVPVQIAHDAQQLVADPTLLSRALVLLLDNAQKHARGVAAVHVLRADGRIRIAVHDHGQGFAPEDLPRLFAPFSRGRGQAPDEAQGLGLGLYLVRRIAEAHGGEAFAHNLVDGAAVGFALPYSAGVPSDGEG